MIDLPWFVHLYLEITYEFQRAVEQPLHNSFIPPTSVQTIYRDTVDRGGGILGIKSSTTGASLRYYIQFHIEFSRNDPISSKHFSNRNSLTNKNYSATRLYLNKQFRYPTMEEGLRNIIFHFLYHTSDTLYQLMSVDIECP